MLSLFYIIMYIKVYIKLTLVNFLLEEIQFNGDFLVKKKLILLLISCLLPSNIDINIHINVNNYYEQKRDH